MRDKGCITGKELIRDRNGFPTKLYHYKLNEGVYPYTKSPSQYLLEVLNANPSITIAPNLYAVAIAWVDVKENKPIRALDVKSFEVDTPWDECNNPEVSTYAFKELVENRLNRKTECRTGVEVFGKEAELAGKMRTFERYLDKWPWLGDLEARKLFPGSWFLNRF